MSHDTFESDIGGNVFEVQNRFLKAFKLAEVVTAMCFSDDQIRTANAGQRNLCAKIAGVKYPSLNTWDLVANLITIRRDIQARMKNGQK